MRRFVTNAIALLLLFCSTSSYAWTQHSLGVSASPNSLWYDMGSKQMSTTGTRYIFPTKYRPLSLNFQGMKAFLALAPSEKHVDARVSTHVLSLPMPEGGFEHFRIVYSPIMEDPLAAMFPEIRTYKGAGIEDPTAYIRLDATPQGFHAMVLRTGKSTVYIDPYAKGDTQLYISYLKKDFVAVNKVMTCDFVGAVADMADPMGGSAQRLFGDCQMRTYRLALSATGEYTAFQGGTVALAQAAQVTTMNRVNGVYEREMAVRLNIVANNNLIVYANSATDPFTNGNPGSMITENQNNTTTVIGNANYDIGHVFGTNSGGLAGLGVVCSNGNKARGVTGSGAPVGDPFDIDYVAHEMGHQFGGNHTFNSNQGACAGNQNNNTAMECGSGTTIMAYAGICGAHDVQANSNDYFHTVSLREIYTFIIGSGNACAGHPGLVNNQPAITTPLANYTIPISTPFVLTTLATDADNDPITYCWEQFDNATNTQPPVSTNTGGPQFRSRPPVTSGSRYFPRLSDLAAGTVSQWEVLSSVTRNLRFACYVRDNHVGGGCGDNDSMTVRTLSTAGPFVVTAPNTAVTWPATSTQNVTWNVANTTAAPISCANVDIFLSTDGGLTYPITLATNVANNGTFAATVPNNPTTTARVMVKARNNIFFDISNVNFTITAPTADYNLVATTTTQAVCAPANAVYIINCQSIGGYTGAVTMSATGVPVGGTATFSPNPVTPGNNVTLTISGTGAIAPGTYTITASGNASSGIHTTTVSLSVTSGVPTAASLTSPANAATNVSTTATLTWAAQTGSTYNIDIATDAGFTTIVRSATALAAASYVPAPALASSTQYFWRVRAVNGCGNGPFSTSRSFTTNSVTCHTVLSTTVPRIITSVGTPIINDSLYFPIGGTITDVNVTNLVGTHTYISDLRMTLISPTGASIVLFSALCGANDDFNIKFDDAGPAYNTIACPMTGAIAYHPSGNLATFNGLVPTGWWKLKIEDLADQDGGSLTAWTLNICANNACILTASTSNNTPVSCNGGTNGAATALPVGGGGPFSYLWSNGATTASVSNFAAGAYSCTITDAFGCAAVANTTIQQPNQLLATATSTATTCGQNNGGVTLAVSGGTPNYTYAWSNGATTATLSNVASGSYTVTITDTRGCTRTASATVATSTAVSANATSTASASCGQSNGAATVAATGGVGNFTYLWSNGATTQNLSGVAAGAYTVTVTSGSPNCTTIASVTIPSIGNVNATVSQVVNTSCGLSNGGGTAVPSGGTSYTYLWSNGATTQSVSGLPAGTYTVTITDVTTCTATATLVVVGSTQVLASTSGVTQTSCGLSNGVATANGTGGNNVYSYSWSNGATTQTVSGLAAGNYTVTVTDGGGCNNVTSVTINSSTAVVTNVFNFTHTSCGLDNGVGSAVSTGGTAPYTYLWSNGQTTPQAANLSAGNYTVTATDAVGCTGTAAVTINGSSAPTASVGTQTNVNCFGGSTGSVNLNVTGGSGPFTYNWTNGQTTNPATGFAAGQFQVTVTDAAGCTSVIGGLVTQPASALAATSTVVDESGPAAADGSIALAPTGGTAPYTYLWSNGQTGQTATGLVGGSYTCTITDANGCTTIVSALVNTLVGVSAGPQLGLEVFPNPSQGVFFASYSLASPEDLQVAVYNKLGQRIWNKTIPQASIGKVEIALGEIASGVYSVELRTANAIVTKKVVVGK